MKLTKCEVCQRKWTRAPTGVVHKCSCGNIMENRMDTKDEEYFLFWGIDASEALSVPAEKVTHHTCGPYDKIGDKHEMQGRPFGVLGGDATDHYAAQYYDDISTTNGGIPVDLKQAFEEANHQRQVIAWKDKLAQIAKEREEHRTISGSALDIQEGGSHYKNCAIQPIEYVMKNNLDHCQANIIKYTTRFRDKGGKEDLLKARHYIDLLIEFEFGDK